MTPSFHGQSGGSIPFGEGLGGDIFSSISPVLSIETFIWERQDLMNEGDERLTSDRFDDIDYTS
jgi:hypothetical protein